MTHFGPGDVGEKPSAMAQALIAVHNFPLTDLFIGKGIAWDEWIVIRIVVGGIHLIRI